MGVRGSGCLSDGQEIGKLPKSSILPFYFSPGPLNSEKSRLKLIGFGQNGEGERPTLLFSLHDNFCHLDFFADNDDIRDSMLMMYATGIFLLMMYICYQNFELKVALNLR